MAGTHHALDAPGLEVLRTMAVELEAYRSGRGNLPGLVSSLDVGISALVDPAPALVEALRKPWRALEEVNALALSEGATRPLEEHLGAAEAAVRDLAAVIEAQLRADSRRSGS